MTINRFIFATFASIFLAATVAGALSPVGYGFAAAYGLLAWFEPALDRWAEGKGRQCASRLVRWLRLRN